MAMPPTGDIAELIHVTHENVNFIVLGPTNPQVVVDSAIPGPMVVATDARALIKSEACLFDDLNYVLQVSSRERCTVFIGGRPLKLIWVQHGFVWVGQTSYVFHEVGWSEITGPWGIIRMRIISRKIDYQYDYHTMVRELEQRARGIVSKLLADVGENMAALDEPVSLWSHWIATLYRLWENLIRDIRWTWDNLPLGLVNEQRMAWIESLQYVKERDIRRYMESGQVRIMARRRTWTLDILERQYLMALIYDILNKLQHIAMQVPDIQEYNLFGQMIAETQKVFHQMQKSMSWKGIIPRPVILSSPLALQHHGLRKVISLHRKLQQALTPFGNTSLVGVKRLSQLYEYWCYIRILSVVLEEIGGEMIRPLGINVNPYDINLIPGARGAMQIRLKTGQLVNIGYERQFQGLPTVSQQPDFLIEVRHKERLLVFDAKYRFEINDRNSNQYGEGIPIPPVDTINTMHQYRDAIVITKPPYERIVERAIVLFPLPRHLIAQWPQHRFFRSIATVGVGAIPLVPGGDDTLLREEIYQFLSP